MLPTSKSHRMILSAAIVVLALVLVSCPASAIDGWITGTVSQSGGSGDPIPGAALTLSGTSNTVTTDSSGNYNITVLAGACTLQVAANGYNAQTSGTINVTEGNTTAGINFRLEKPSGNLTGTVIDDDDGVPIAGVTISYPSGGPPSPTVQTDSGGRYLLSDLPVGTLLMNLTASQPFNSQNFTVTIRSGQTIQKNFQLRANTYLSIAVKGGGKPLPGATVNAGNFSGTTDTSGMVRLEVRPGTYDVEVTAEGYTTAKLTILVEKGKTTSSTVTISKTGGGGGTIGGGSMLLIAGAAAAVVVVLGLLVFIMMRRKKNAARGSAAGPYGSQASPAAGAPGQAPWDSGPQVPGRPKTEAEKRKEWADFERMYGRPHPEAPGWVGGASASNAPKPKCPIDDIVVNFEPYSGMYFCSRCHERYPADRVFGKQEAPAQSAQAPAPQYQPPPQSQNVPSGPQQQPSWAAQTPAAGTVAAPPPPPPGGMPPYQPPPPGGMPTYPPPPPSATMPVPPAPPLYLAPPQAPMPPAAAPMEARPVAKDENVPAAWPPQDDVIPPGTGPVFNLPPPLSYEDGTVPPPAHKPPEDKES